MSLPPQYWAAFATFMAALTFNLVSFIVPLWIESYEPTQSQFTKMGLWEVCFVDYVHEDDVEGRVWNGCYSTIRQGKIKDIREWICPSWFVAVQVLGTFSMLTLVLACILLMVHFARLCPTETFEYIGLQVAAFATLIAGLFEFIIITIFGVKGDNQLWLPRPDINHYSWSYAFAVFSCLFCFISCGLLFFVASQIRVLNRKNRQLSTMQSRQGASKDQLGGSRPLYGSRDELSGSRPLYGSREELSGSRPLQGSRDELNKPVRRAVDDGRCRRGSRDELQPLRSSREELSGSRDKLRRPVPRTRSRDQLSERPVAASREKLDIDEAIDSAITSLDL